MDLRQRRASMSISPHRRRHVVFLVAGGLAALTATAACASASTDVEPESETHALPVDPLAAEPIVSSRAAFPPSPDTPARHPVAENVAMLGDLNPGAASSLPYEFRGANRRMFLVAADPAHGREPWVSDGTPQGTALISDLAPGPASSSPRAFTGASHGVVFLTDSTDAADPDAEATGHLWSTDAVGTGADVGTTTLLASGPTLLGVDGAPLGGDALLMTSNFADNAQLWRSDGTAAGTVLVKQHLILGLDLKPAGPFAFFTDAQNPLWRTDGTPAGTRLLRGWPDGQSGSTVLLRFTVVGQRGYFQVDSLDSVGAELWVSDGTRAGTRLVKDIRPGPASSKPFSLAARGRSLFFVANDGRHGRQLWRSDGTAAGTVRLTNLFAGHAPTHMGHVTGCHGSLYFTAAGPPGKELWVSSGRRGEARQVADLAPGPPGSNPNRLTCIKDGLAFSADDGRNGRELWTVASPSSAPILHDLFPTGSSRPSRLTRLGPALFFSANDGMHGREPWTLRR
jgi:ELWxxDGT repeat protein